MIEKTLDAFFTDRCEPATVSDLERTGDIRPLWDAIEDLGFTQISVPEERGGSGGTTADALDMVRSAGRHAVPLPLAETALLAGWALTHAGLDAGAGMSTIAPVHPDDTFTAEPTSGGVILSGRATLVPWASVADRIVVLATGPDGELWLAMVSPTDAQILPGKNLAGEPRDTVTLVGAYVPESRSAIVSFALETYFVRGALARAAAMLGALERVRDLTISHARTREQFGRSLSQFQAVQQMLAVMARDVALVRSAVELATAAVEDDDAAGWLASASAKTLAGIAAGTVSSHAHQIHGAIGVTSEYPLSILTRRLWGWRAEHGTEEEWSRRIGERAVAHPEGVWGLVTEDPRVTAMEA